MLSVKKSKKACATCTMWIGKVDPHGNSLDVRIESDERGMCLKDKHTYKQDHYCSHWEQRFK